LRAQRSNPDKPQINTDEHRLFFNNLIRVYLWFLGNQHEIGKRQRNKEQGRQGHERLIGTKSGAPHE
jgi:hypothetical protein